MPLPIENGPEETRAHPPHTGRGHVDLVLALAAIFISLVSLFVAVEHGRTEQKLLAASTWPFLQETHEGGDTTDTVTVVNAGVGPAKLATLRLFLDGRTVADIGVFAKLCCGMTPAETRAAFVSSNMENSVLRPGQRNLVLQSRFPAADDPHRHAEIRAAQRLTFEACFCSVFDECWRSELASIRATPVASCPLSTDSFNQNYFSAPAPS